MVLTYKDELEDKMGVALGKTLYARTLSVLILLSNNNVPYDHGMSPSLLVWLVVPQAV